MAYYLLSETANTEYRVRVPTGTLIIPIGGSLEFDMDGHPSFNKNGLLRVFGGDDFLNICEYNNSYFRVRINSSSFITVNWLSTGVDVYERHLLRLDRTATEYKLYYNDEFQGDIVTTEDGNFTQLLGLVTGSTESFYGKTYGVKRRDSGGVLINYWNPSSSGGTGLVLPDDISGADGTLVGSWPTDNSQWVFYAAAGATYSITFDPATYAYTGADLSLLVSRSISFDAGNYSYSGVDLNLSASRNISLDAGNYTVTGNDISLLASRVLSFDEGSYAYSGNDLTLTYNPATGATYTLSFDAGNYLYTGNDLTTLANRKLALDAGTYTYTGNNRDLLTSRKLSFDAGTYAYTGNDLTLTYTPITGSTYFISLNAGSYVVSGNTINLAANRALLLDAGSYTLAGEPVTLATNRKLSLDAGSYAVTGNDADLIAHRSITLESGKYDYLGNPITLTYSGQIISLIDDYSVNYTNDFVTASYANNYINAEFK